MDINNNNVPVEGAQASAPAVQPAPAVVAPAPTVQPEPAVVSTPQAPVTQPVVPTNSFELPQGVSDRTKEQFDRLTDSNRKLLEANQVLEQELSRRTSAENQFAPIQQPVVPQQPDVQEFLSVDPLTGERYVDENKLQSALDKATSRAVQAEQQVKNYIETQQRKEVIKQEEETYNAFPQLNPENMDKFDAELNRLTRAYALDSMMNPKDYRNRSLTFKEAAEMAHAKLYGNQPIAAPSTEAQQVSNTQPVTQQITDANTQPTQQGQTVSSPIQEQGGMAAEGGPVNVNPESLNTDLFALQDKTRRGDMWALAKRLTQVPHTGTPTHSEGE